VQYLAEETVRIWGEFDSKGRPVSFKCDIVIDDANYGAGVVEIDGEIHTKLSKEKKDERRDKALKRQNLWVEHILNEDVEGIMAILEKHRRQRDDYS
jgi:very-short-patch-repair endonuclease